MRGGTLLILGHKIKGQGQLWHILKNTYGHDTVYSFCSITSNFACKLLMMRGGTLLIFGNGVKGQDQLWPPCKGMPRFAVSSYDI